MRPWMSAPEMELFKNSINRKNTVIEFGCGGSTILAVQQNINHIISVESDKRWIDQLQNHEALKPHMESGMVQFVHADIGEIGEWGYPKDRGSIERWPAYWMGAWQNVNPENIDCVFVDGRFRVACALYAITKVKNDTCIIMHDFWSRTQYHAVKKYVSCVASVDDLAVFSINKDIDQNSLLADVLAHAFDAD